jgi:fatty-acyl-CoA synthase
MIQNHPRLANSVDIQGDRDENRIWSREAWLRALKRTASISRNPDITLPIAIDAAGNRFGPKPALISQRQSLTYGQLADRSKQYSVCGLRIGIEAGDVVCLLMPNCPEYLAIWLGITRIGGVVSLLNTNLVGDSLLHSINAVAAKHVIFSVEFTDAVQRIAHHLPARIQLWAHGEAGTYARIDEEVDATEPWALENHTYHRPTIHDRALFIYTSGTTGRPKAANVSHFRLMQWSEWFAGMMDVGPNDRMYNCLPMYHSSGGVVAPCSSLIAGASVVLREHFSARAFWDDVVDTQCTMFQYIGELCRFLVNTPKYPKENQHNIRLACGNGLGADVWNEFQTRFRIPKILEFYAATEGNMSLYNCEGKVGAIGRIPAYLPQRASTALIKLDPITDEPIRNTDGYCIRASSNEIGEAVGRISSPTSNLTNFFEGYTDESASARKIISNVFSEGDVWLRTGDLMREDQDDFFYFVDRIGDTIRWKGENVSTTQVAATISASPGVIHAVVYGVSVPRIEGNAGMAAIVIDDTFDLVVLRNHLEQNLPTFAQPLFLRVVEEIDFTATFKSMKRHLSEEAYNPLIVADPIYFNDRTRRVFLRMDADLYANIKSGRLHL